ncbi:hypothetical protein [Coleofasciculus sp. G2-EDA-02]|uniref:hypothetical protein n=1 Tax=Coleofasciculus sp. G2-EDA-02 TaxID=3069529 RepID=UPI0032F11F66
MTRAVLLDTHPLSQLSVGRAGFVVPLLVGRAGFVVPLSVRRAGFVVHLSVNS